MRKHLTGIISLCLQNFLEEEKILPKEQKGCKKGRTTNLAMAWIDYRKPYYMISHS